MNIASNITELIGNTPIVRINALNHSGAEVVAKLECCNPMSSVKDRIGFAMIDAAEKARIEEAIVKVKKAIEGDDIDAIKKTQEDLTNASHKLAEAMYAKSTAQQGGSGPQPGAGAGAQAGAGKKDDDVVDADFEEVI